MGHSELLPLVGVGAIGGQGAAVVGIWEKWGGHKARVGSGPVSPPPFHCHPALPGWELLSPGQSDLIWHPLCFLQE